MPVSVSSTTTIVAFERRCTSSLFVSAAHLPITNLRKKHMTNCLVGNLTFFILARKLSNNVVHDSGLNHMDIHQHVLVATMSFAFALSSRGWNHRFTSGCCRLLFNKIRLFASAPPAEFSQRGKDAVSLLPTYLADARAVEKYSPLTAPHGALQLSVAENQMLEDLLVPALSEFATLKPFTSDCIYYQPTQGRESLRIAMAAYLQRLLGLSKPLNVNHLIMGAGCNAVLENLCFCLTQPGDAVLIPTPYYAAFEFDLVARAGVAITPVNTVDHYDTPFDDGDDIPVEAYYPNKVSLEAAYHHAIAKGHPPRILLLSHPHNPLGICYPAHVVLECIEWCRHRQIHLISDEIYAGSVYRRQQPAQDGSSSSSSSDNNDNYNDDVVPFVSILALCSNNNANGDNHNNPQQEQHQHDTPTPTSTTVQDSSSLLGLGPFVHLVYALSKDFGLSGLRIGACYTENQDILLPLQKLNDLCQISSHSQVLVETMLTATTVNDDDINHNMNDSLFWTDGLLQENRKRLLQRCIALEEVLTECQIPFLKPTSGLFLWLNLSEFLVRNKNNCQNNASNSEKEKEEDDNKDDELDDEQRERRLYLQLLHDHGLLFTPGLSMRHSRPGYFRCVFTAASDEEFRLSLDRIRSFVQRQRKTLLLKRYHL